MVLLLQAGLVISCSKIVEPLEEPEPDSTPAPIVEEPVSPSVPSAFTIYKIMEGSHHAYNVPMQTVSGNSLVFKARFDSSCVYTARKPQNQDDINKLYGFSDNATNHQTHSARVGWRWKNERIELFAYCYAFGNRSFTLLGTANLNEWVDLSIRLSAAGYEFQYKGASTFMKRGPSQPTIGGFMLFPYFGGDESAPHTVRIDIAQR